MRHIQKSDYIHKGEELNLDISLKTIDTVKQVNDIDFKLECRYVNGEDKYFQTSQEIYIRYRDTYLIRKYTKDCLDLPIFSSDPAQASELVGIYLLYKLNGSMPDIDSGLYRDEVLFTKV